VGGVSVASRGNPDTEKGAFLLGLAPGKIELKSTTSGAAALRVWQLVQFRVAILKIVGSRMQTKNLLGCGG
jgi:hypothetical protein